MVATSVEQLEQMLMKQINTAMQEIQNESDKIMKKNLSEFYSQGDPKRYKRTHALENTPKTSGVSSSGNASTFLAYLEQGHTYSTGRDLRYMRALLPQAEAGAYGILGKSGFWQRSVNEIEEIAPVILSRYCR